MKIIGLCGFKNSGKTTVANHLIEKYGFVEVSFASPLKDITAILYGFDRDMLEGDTIEKRNLRETVKDPIWDRTGREALQYLGTEIFRTHHDEGTWVKIAMREIEKLTAKGYNVVISDVRFQNECTAIEKLGGEMWQINRYEYTDSEIADMHPSESSFTKFKKIQVYINNYESVDNLKSIVNAIMA